MLVSANGITLHAETAGYGDLTLIFLPYFGGTARSWAPVIEALPGWVRSIALDMRGWGGSDRPDTGYDIATLADDVQAAVSALGVRRYILVGHSMGGKIAQLLASRRPAGLAGLVLVAPSPAQGKILSDAEREGMAGAYNSAEAISWTIDNILAGSKLKPEWRAQIIADSLGGGAAAKAFWPACAIAEDVSAALQSINVPVLVLGGEFDKVDSIEMLRGIVVPALPAAKFTVMAGIGHLVPFEAPEALARLLRAYISELKYDEPALTLQPEDLASRFDQAFCRGDLDALMALFCQDAMMRMTDGTLVSGTTALRKALGDLIAMAPKLRNRIRRIIVNQKTALLLLDWELFAAQPGGQDIVQRGTATQILERCRDGNWRLLISNPLGIA